MSLPVGAGEEDVAADGHRIIPSSLQAEEAALRYVDAAFQGGEARRWPIHPHGDGFVLLPRGEVYGGFSERFTVQGVDLDTGRDGIPLRIGATIAIGYACGILAQARRPRYRKTVWRLASRPIEAEDAPVRNAVGPKPSAVKGQSCYVTACMASDDIQQSAF